MVIGALVLVSPGFEDAVDADPQALIADIVERTTRLERIVTLPEPE